ncbi:MAG TPA: hypothetical protein VJL89_12855 [Thermodesulfovibrionia bacterium]|nr:hypothetical protein [Thermodesulfovibrionia bacterium]
MINGLAGLGGNNSIKLKLVVGFYFPTKLVEEYGEILSLDDELVVAISTLQKEGGYSQKDSIPQGFTPHPQSQQTNCLCPCYF